MVECHLQNIKQNELQYKNPTLSQEIILLLEWKKDI